jgi:SAM-dependent methyltransferase
VTVDGVDAPRRAADALLARLAELGLGRARGAALDLGCGGGGLTQALAAHYERVVGVDWSAPAIRRARSANRFGRRCRYLVNVRPHLGCLGASSFDLVHGGDGLAELDEYEALGYLREALRLLAPGGAAVFRFPLDWSGAAARQRMAAPEALVAEIVRANGARLVDVEREGASPGVGRRARYWVAGE